MLSTGCPKCTGREILLIESVAGTMSMRTMEGNHITTGLSAFSEVPVTRLLCVACGFTEEWVVGREQIDKLVSAFGPPTTVK